MATRKKRNPGPYKQSSLGRFPVDKAKSLERYLIFVGFNARTTPSGADMSNVVVDDDQFREASSYSKNWHVGLAPRGYNYHESRQNPANSMEQVAESYAFHQNNQRGPYSATILATDISGPYTVLLQGLGGNESANYATQQAAEFYAHHWLDNVMPVEHGGLEAAGGPLLLTAGTGAAANPSRLRFRDLSVGDEFFFYNIVSGADYDRYRKFSARTWENLDSGYKGKVGSISVEVTRPGGEQLQWMGGTSKGGRIMKAPNPSSKHYIVTHPDGQEGPFTSREKAQKSARAYLNKYKQRGLLAQVKIYAPGFAGDYRTVDNIYYNDGRLSGRRGTGRAPNPMDEWGRPIDSQGREWVVTWEPVGSPRGPKSGYTESQRFTTKADADRYARGLRTKGRKVQVEVHTSNPSALDWYEMGYASGSQGRKAGDVGIPTDPDVDSRSRFDFIWDRAKSQGARNESASRAKFQSGYYDAYSQRARSRKGGRTMKAANPSTVWEIYNHKTGYTMGRVFPTKKEAESFIQQLRGQTSTRLYWKARRVSTMQAANPSGEEIPIDVMDLDDRSKGVIETIYRTPKAHAGWQSVTYKGKRYQLYGGIRGDYFINVSHPLKGKRNPIGKSDWGQLAFEAGKDWYMDPASEYVSRSSSSSYGLAKWLNSVGSPPRGKGITQAYLQKSFNEGVRAGGRISRKRNPDSYPDSEPEAAALYQTFHGTDSTQIAEVEEVTHSHDWLTQLGILQSLKIDTESGIHVEIDFSKDDVILASDESGRQLYLTGGNQTLNLSDLKMSGSKWRKDLMEIGKVRELTYRTKKKFDAFKTIDYFHGLGEETGVMPTLLFDTLSDQLKLAGGHYSVRPEGIVN